MLRSEELREEYSPRARDYRGHESNDWPDDTRKLIDGQIDDTDAAMGDCLHKQKRTFHYKLCAGQTFARLVECLRVLFLAVKQSLFGVPLHARMAY